MARARRCRLFAGPLLVLVRPRPVIKVAAEAATPSSRSVRAGREQTVMAAATVVGVAPLVERHPRRYVRWQLAAVSEAVHRVRVEVDPRIALPGNACHCPAPPEPGNRPQR